MAILNWDGTLTVGHDVIDGQHKSLVELINRLYVSHVIGDGNEDIKKVLMELYKYTMFHFAAEEALMDKIEPSLASAHKLEHASFVRKLDALAERAKLGDIRIEGDTFSWLVGWLLNHISVTDKQLVGSLVSK